MEPVASNKVVNSRIIMANSKELSEKGKDTEIVSSGWYSGEIPLPLDRMITDKAKELGKDLITIVTETIEQKVYEVK